ncbi:MAG: orotidine-5'-phosphate decarboxylase [Vampirovibrionales bacterium]|nr:orotidine-5'-phosphate decarboxylase [Vampirovibrionales bacterium]
MTPDNKAKTISADKIFVALDLPDKASAVQLVETLSPLGVSFKIGMQLFYAEGMPLVKTIQKRLEQSPQSQLFIDLKLHDIPSTVAKASEALVAQGVTFFNLHTLGGAAMMRAAKDAVEKTANRLNLPLPTLIGVTVLTSHDQTSLQTDLQVESDLTRYVQHLARLAKHSGLHGVVCSAQEAAVIKETCGNTFLKVTPGIRMPDHDSGDQSRILTPKAAFEAGATHLVIGRPITQANDPAEATRQILQTLGL